MLQINSITDEQIARFSEWTQKWIEIGLSTEEADFETATKAALEAYKLCNLERPMIILRMNSPYGATVGGALAWLALKDLCSDKKLKKLKSQVRLQVWSQVQSQVESQVGLQVWSQVQSQVESQVESQVWSQVGDCINNDRGGSFWASWCAYISFMRDVLGWSDPALERFKIDEILTKSCGWVWWHENILAISDKPKEINRDERGFLHCESRPAISYRDGWSLYYWHGVSVPQYVIENPEKITIELIEQEENSEIRRVMVERYGIENYIQNCGAKLIHKDNFGELYRKEQQDDEPLVMVKVKNSSPEPDGHFKDYFLRVPPGIQTAHEAVSWTFGIDKKDYKPLIET